MGIIGRRVSLFAKQTDREPRIRSLYFIEGAAFFRVYGYDGIEKAAAPADEGASEASVFRRRALGESAWLRKAAFRLLRKKWAD